MVTLNSKKIQPGDTFICLPGGEPYIEEARARGASDVLPMTRTELGHWADQHFNQPSKHLIVIGVTGTNGKTTVTHLVAQALKSAGFTPEVQGTLSGPLTTPESLDTHQHMAEHLAKGGTHFIMEVSSHAIDQDRIAGIQFSVKCLTNITQDHLDYHQTFENYESTKLGWMNRKEDFRADSPQKALFPADYKQETLTFETPLIGQFNLENMQATVAILKAIGMSPDTIASGLVHAQAPAGRFESVNAGQPFLVIVDYAHTPDGLEKILTEGKALAQTRHGQLIVVFGCGGDRDRGKRPKMAAVAEQFANQMIVTQDNPRHEDPEQIMADILTGFSPTATFKIIQNRKTAIQTAIQTATDPDVVIIAGKGHETYQLVKGNTLHFDDREEARLAITQEVR